MNDVTAETVQQFYERITKYQMSLVTEKHEEPEKQKEVTKKLTAINSLASSLMRVRNILRDC
jgi:fumarate hydratase class II